VVGVDIPADLVCLLDPPGQQEALTQLMGRFVRPIRNRELGGFRERQVRVEVYTYNYGCDSWSETARAKLQEAAAVQGQRDAV
jgi:superfamily II DNA or RNA helicase